MWPSAAIVAHFAMTPAIAMLRMIHTMFIDMFARREDSRILRQHRKGMCGTGQWQSKAPTRLASMSERNGDRARFQKDRKRKLHHRQCIQVLRLVLRNRAAEQASTRDASLNMHDEGGPARIGD